MESLEKGCVVMLAEVLVVGHLGHVGSRIPFISIHRPSPRTLANKWNKTCPALMWQFMMKSQLYIWKYSHSGKSHANLDFLVQWNTSRIKLDFFPFLARYPMTWMAFVKGTVMCFSWIWSNLCRAVSCKCVLSYPTWNRGLIKFLVLKNKQTCGLPVVSSLFLWALWRGLSVDNLVIQNNFFSPIPCTPNTSGLQILHAMCMPFRAPSFIIFSSIIRERRLSWGWVGMAISD